jgi:hypothetical protein
MFPQARKEKLNVRELPDETLVYDQEHRKAHCLNRTAALVWKHCDGQTDIAALARLLHEQLQVPDAETVVRLALDQLARRHLLVGELPPLSASARLSRRQVLASVVVAAVALPLITTISAPSAFAHLTPPKGACQSDQDCINLGAATGKPASDCMTFSCVNRSCVTVNRSDGLPCSFFEKVGVCQDGHCVESSGQSQPAPGACGGPCGPNAECPTGCTCSDFPPKPGSKCLKG